MCHALLLPPRFHTIIQCCINSGGFPPGYARCLCPASRSTRKVQGACQEQPSFTAHSARAIPLVVGQPPTAGTHAGEAEPAPPSGLRVAEPLSGAGTTTHTSRLGVFITKSLPHFGERPPQSHGPILARRAGRSR